MARGDCVCSLNEYIVIVWYILLGRVVVCVRACMRARACVRFYSQRSVHALVYPQ